MDSFNIYRDIAERTQGDIYVGVVGPVRTGKSTFIKKFMDTMVIPKINNTYKKERAKDELPQSGSGKTIHTTEPKFVPNEAIEITIDDDVNFKVRLIDCVGYIVKGALGYLEDDEPKIVASTIKEFGAITKNKALIINITNLDNNQKAKLRGALKFFTGEKNNMQVYILNGDRKDPAGGIFINNQILREFEEIAR